MNRYILVVFIPVLWLLSSLTRRSNHPAYHGHHHEQQASQIEPNDNAVKANMYTDVFHTFPVFLHQRNRPAAIHTFEQPGSFAHGSHAAHLSCGVEQPYDIVRTAAFFDNTLCSKFGNSWRRTASYVMNQIRLSGQAYANHTCLFFRVVYIEAHCNDDDDPFAKSKMYFGVETILDSFLRFLDTKRLYTKRDFAILYVGYRVHYAAGSAILGGMCQPSSSATWSTFSDWSVTAHEIGHLFGCRHIPNTNSIMDTEAKMSIRRHFAPQCKMLVNKFLQSGIRNCLLRTFTPPKASPIITFINEKHDTPEGSCASKFIVKQLPKCLNFEHTVKVKMPSSGREVVVVVGLKFAQTYDSFSVSGEITKYGTFFNFRRVMTAINFGSWPSISDRVWYSTHHRVKFEDVAWFTQWKPLPGRDTCCGSYMYTMFGFEVCSTTDLGNCRVVKRQIATRLSCEDPCAGKEGTLQLIRRKCPSCGTPRNTWLWPIVHDQEI